MPKNLTTPDHLFDRTWRPGHPFRPRISRARRWFMGFVLVVLSTLICGYWYITDSRRVRAEAETYLSRLLGGNVKVASATLSIFQGLKLDDVRLMTDRSNRPESLLFSAQSFMIEVNLKALLTGRLEASRIMAIEPRVHLAEDAVTGERNYNRLLESHTEGGRGGPGGPSTLVLPEIVLRNAQILYSRHQRGQIIETGAIAVEGQLTPIPASKVYRFSLQSRSRATEIGPVISGEIVMGTGQINASLQNLPFDTDVKNMLPPEVRRWWEQHGLSGRVSIPVLNFAPPTTPNGRAGYRVELELQGVTLVAHPEEWMSSDEHRTLRDVRQAFDVMRVAGLNGKNFVDRVSELVEPGPISLRHVRGRFIFSDDQTIQIDNLYGSLEEMPFKINGKIKGYTPDAEASIRIASSDLQDIEIPAVPRYLNSLPPAVREVYDRFKPRGTCRFWVEMNRTTPGARPVVTGEITIVDGNFTFERFPYPLRKATGRILLGQNIRNGEENLTIDHIRGRGIEGGPNADRFVEVNGVIGPFGPEAQVDISVKGEQISSEPALVAAFPSQTRAALKIFDAPGKGEFPKFTGDFECKIVRLRGVQSRWIIETGINLHDAAGSLVAFPYPMSGVRGNLKILDDHIDLTGITMSRGDAKLSIDGKVSWQSGKEPRVAGQGPSLKPNLKIVATGIPIDNDLLNALPPSRSAWLRQVGAGGKIDLDGTIRPGTNGQDMDYDLRIALSDGVLWPVDGMFAVTGVNGNLRLLNQRMTLTDLRGRRGDGDVTARGEISWQDEAPQVAIQAQATNLVLEPTLYKLLPETGRAAIDQVRPDGTVDVAVNFNGAVSEAVAGGNSKPAGAYQITITPRRLSANPRAVPYQLDQVAGSVTILPERVVLNDLTAKHGDARVRLSGTGQVGKEQVWEFLLSGENVPVDDDLKRAVPKSLAELMQSMQLGGKVNFDFTKLRVMVPQQAGAAATKPDAEVPPNLDFVVRLGTDAASMDVGVPLSDMKGAMTLTGSSRNGKVSGLTGKMEVESFTMAGRPVTRFSADVLKEAGRDQVTIRNMQAQIAKGTMAGQIDYAFSDNTASRYMVNLNLHNADVKELAGETEAEIQGLVKASLAIEGTAGQTSSRRGRGDVLVNGERLYRIPLVLGLLQITNLSLPIQKPFNEGSARYSIDGDKVTFETIEFRSPQMLMQGNGQLDFNTRKVRMRFFADSTAWPKLPVITDVLSSARGELLQFEVLGTLQEPKVSARVMNTLTTTVDKISGADGKPASQVDGR